MAMLFAPVSRSTLFSFFFAALLAFAMPSHALKILLVNDDGCNAPGINVLADALQSASIEIVAPASSVLDGNLGTQQAQSDDIKVRLNNIAP